MRPVLRALTSALLAFATPAFSAIPPSATEALFLLFDVHRSAGRAEDALAALERLNGGLPPADVQRARLADAYERIGERTRAVAVWEGLDRDGKGLPADSRMRLARLYELTNRKADALEVWTSLLEEGGASAQRAQVEDRLIALAEELSMLESLARGLRAELARGESGQHVSRLLIRLYARMGERAVAIEAVEDMQGADAVTRLSAQAEAYRLLGERTAYARTLNQLVDLDPSRSADHLRRLILNEIERGEGSEIDEVRRLLERLREVDSERSSGEFEGGALAMARLTDEAIAAYRRAIAADPTRGGSWLLLGDLLKKQQRADEALALFQALADGTTTDAQFVTAIDGITNALAREDDAPLDKRTTAALHWARVRVLQRLILRGEQAHFYPMLEELASDLYETERRVTALETALTPFEGRRLATLRELFALTGPADPDASGGAASVTYDDPRLHLRFGRRLLALDQELPPDVHVALAKAFLRRGEQATADRIFRKAAEVSGRNSVLITAAEEFEKSGMDAKAAQYYSRVLVSDRRNIGVLLRLAHLRHRAGDAAAANDLYGDGLRLVLRQLPARGAEPSHDFRTHYEDLLRGYLATWPREPARAEGQLDQLQSMLERELSFAGDEPRSGVLEPLQSHLRLDRIARFLRRVAFATGNATRADRWDARLRATFASDEGLAASLAQERLEWNLFASARRFAPRADDPQLDAPIARGLAVANADRGEILALARQWAESGAPAAAARWARGKLEASEYASLCRHILDLMRRQDRRGLQDMLVKNPQFVLEVEEVTGERMVSSAELMKLLREPGFFKSGAWNADATAYLGKRLAPEDVLDWMRRVTAHSSSDPYSIAHVLGLWGAVLEKPLEPAFANALATQVIASLRKLEIADAQVLDNHEAMLILPRTDPANLDWARKVSEAWRQQARSKLDYFTPVYLLIEGETVQALDALAALSIEMAQQSGFEEFASAHQRSFRALYSAFLPRHLGELEQRLQSASARARYLLLHSSASLFIGAESGGHPSKTLEVLEDVLAESPDDEEFLVRLHAAYLNQGHRYDALKILRRLHERHPQDPIYRGALFRNLLELDHPVDASKLNEASPEDMRQSGYYEQLVQLQSRQSGPSRLLLLPPLSSEAPSAESYYELVQQRARVLAAMRSGDSVSTVNALRMLWQKIAVSTTHGVHLSADVDPLSLSYKNALNLPVSEADPAKLFEAAALSSAELDSYLRPLDTKSAAKLHELYGYVIAAWRREGKIEQQRAVLERAVHDESADIHVYSLWLTLLAQQENALSENHWAVFRRLLAHDAYLSPHHLLLMARIHASAKRMADAERTYRLLLVRTLVRDREFHGILNARELIAEIEGRLPGPQAQPLVSAVIRLVEPDTADSPTMHRLHDAFVAAVRIDTLSAREVLGLLQRAASAGHASLADQPTLLAAYGAMLGIASPGNPAAAMHAIVDALPASAPGRADKPASLQDVAAALAEPAARDRFPGDSALEVSALLARRLHERGDGAAVRSVMRNISARMSSADRYGYHTLQRMLVLAEQVGIPLELSALGALMDRGQLDGRQAAGLVRRVAAEEGAERALAVGERAAEYSHHPHLIDSLIAAATAAANEERSRYWLAVKRADAMARRELAASS